MSLLSQVKTGISYPPPRIICYGLAGIGKTTLAASAPKAILIDIEGGAEGTGMARFPQATSFDTVIEQIAALIKEDHEYKTLVIDSIDHLEKLIWIKTASRLKVSNIHEMPYGRGFSEAISEWQYLIKGLETLRARREMAVIILAHSEVKRYDDPSSDPYDRHQIALHKAASALIQEWADAVLFYGWKVTTKVSDGGFGRRIVRGKGNGARLIHTEERPAALAKNRYAMPDIIEIPDSPADAWDTLASHIPYFSAQSAPSNNQLTDA
ncbi:ATP-binding protein [Kozakia baliensis]|uniref:ATP-binding protein n=1 Tax=Kozakia baliensis TaxID=153496 RepID=UPI000495F488|nr:ATP-binding protein [Kozakia baliensis]